MNEKHHAGLPAINYLTPKEAKLIAHNLSEWACNDRTAIPLEFLLAFARLEARGDIEVTRRHNTGKRVFSARENADEGTTSSEPLVNGNERGQR